MRKRLRLWITKIVKAAVNRPRYGAGGYGLALLMVFLASSLMMASSLQIMNSTGRLAYVNASMSNFSARQIADIGMKATLDEIQAQLNADAAITTSYRYPASGSNTVSMPRDPTNLGGATDPVGTYYATVTQARGNSYIVKVTATVGNSTVQKHRLIQMQNIAAVADDDDGCSAVTNEILAGNVASISNADLIAWAQNNCMVYTASTTVTAPSVSDGSASSCTTYSGSGTLKLATVSGSCATYLDGTYDTVYLKSGSSTASSNAWLYSYPQSGLSGTRTIHVPGTVASGTDMGALYDDPSYGGGESSKPHTFLFNAITGTSIYLYGGAADDLFSFNGNSSVYKLEGGNGNNTIVISGTYGSSSQTLNLYPSRAASGATGNNTVYIDTIGGSYNTNIIEKSSGSMHLYFNSFTTYAAANIYGSTGDDIIACGVAFDGGTGVCGSMGMNAEIFFRGYGGKDIISLDFQVNRYSSVSGYDGSTTNESVANIIYFKGCQDYTEVNVNSTKGVVVVGGNRGIWSAVTGAGNSVALVKTGTTGGASSSITGFARTLNY